jgi:beta-glucan synthesis-associated protein KRE6
VDVSLFKGQVSQSYQTAPYDYQYSFVNTTPATIIQNPSITQINTYQGGIYQQAVSAVSYIDSSYYNNTAYTTYGFEYWSDPKNRGNGYITWYSEGTQTWTMNPAAVGPDPISQVSQRIIPEEPMVSFPKHHHVVDNENKQKSQYMIFNFGMSRE